MRQEIDCDGYKVTFEESPSLKEAVYAKVLEWFKQCEAFNGESIMQNDTPIIEAPGLLAAIADDLFKFKIDE